MSASSAVEKKTGKSYFFTWWRIDPAELEKQVSQYDTLGFWQAARRTSAFLCFLSVTITVLLGLYIHMPTDSIAIEVVLWLVLGYFMYRGHRWAFVAGMIAWTLEKAFMLFGGGATGRVPIVQVIWWAIYMQAFFLGYNVEKERARRSLAPA